MSTPQTSAKIRFGEMRHQVSEFAPIKVQALIQVLDFEAIKLKLQDPTHGLGWSREKTDRVERMYRRFLFLQVTSAETVVPTTDIDAFWHGHILDTQKYADDCKTAFGFFLHHFPYFGLRGKEDAKKLQLAFERSKALYENTYGEAYVTDPTTAPAPGIEAAPCHDGAGCG